MSKPARPRKTPPAQPQPKRRLAIKQALADLPALDELAASVGVALDEIPATGRRYLAALLETGKHARALDSAGLVDFQYHGLYRQPPFRTIVRAIREMLEETRRDVVDDLIYESATGDDSESDRLLMWRAERTDPRYSPPNSPARHSDRDGPHITVRVVLAPGQAITVGNGGGFLGPILGQRPPA